jgi:hypothetical protein
MKRTPRSPRASSSLSESTNRKLNTYALAASAAGVGLFALTQSAEAKIVYTGTWVEISPFGTVPLDVNHDGIADFKFSNVGYSTSVLDVLKVVGVQSNRIWGTGRYASALPAGVRIGPKGKFQVNPSLMAKATQCYYYSCSKKNLGLWANVTHRYLGLKFSINGEFHYGWARLNVTVEPDHAAYAALTGYAYETVPNTPIITGNTAGPDEVGHVPNDAATPTVTNRTSASLGTLARGALALDIWRKRDPN